MKIDRFYNLLWQDFVSLAPQAAAIKEKLELLGENVVNDHVAFRTFNMAPINLNNLESYITALGYRRLDSYHFAKKHLDAWSYIRPAAGGSTVDPLIFFSELNVSALSEKAQVIIRRLVNENAVAIQNELEKLTSEVEVPFFCRGRVWSMVTYNEYQQLLAESEYAAWVAVHGFHANHFTVSLNHLKQRRRVEAVLEWVTQQGYTVNEVGGRVKGSPAVRLEQGSTMADQVAVTFSCGHTEAIPGGFYEFARRYPTDKGDLFLGFVESNADKIFESTSSRLNRSE